MKNFIPQLFKFGIVGVSATIVHYSVAAAVFFIFNERPLLSNTIGYFSGMTVTYLGNKFWVFRKREGFDDIGKFCIVAFVTYIVSQVSFGASYEFFRAWFTETQSFNLSFLPMIFCVTLWSFSINKIWVFKSR